jgi:DNA-damage-inducible protein D
MSSKDTKPATSVALFQEKTVRRVWYQGKWYFSVVDVIAILTESANPRRYWSDLKRKLVAEGYDQLYENIVQLKMMSSDQKSYVTDAADTTTLLRIIQSVPSPKADPLKRWLAEVGTQRIEEIENPELAMERGAKEGLEYAILTNEISQATFGVGIQQHKAIKGLKRENVRDHMTDLELILTMLGEETAKTLHQTRDTQGFDDLQVDTKEAGNVAGSTRQDIERRTGQPVVNSSNYLHLTAGRKKKSLQKGEEDTTSKE